MADVDRLILTCAKDSDAFRALMQMFQDRIYSFLIHLAGHEAADDLFQEVWLRVFQAAPRYEPRGKGASWLFKIANNVALSHFRRRGMDRPLVVGEELDAFASKSCPDPAQAAARTTLVP